MARPLSKEAAALINMSDIFDLLVKGGTLVNHDGSAQRDVAIRDGRIVDIGQFDRAQAASTVDASGLHVLPGVIDTQVHFREPGLTHKEDLESGSRGAVLGGVTSVFEMPNTNPLTTGEAELADKLDRARGRMHCDFAFWVGGTHENASHVADLERLPGAAGIKVFMGSSTGALLVADDEGVRAILRNTRRRAAFHSEDEARLNQRKALREENNPASHPIWRDTEVALHCTERLISIARVQSARIHILHISTGDELALLRANKDVVSCEVTPHHLTLESGDYQRLGTRLQMNPPVREAHHRDRLWQGLRAGILDILGSDHAPHTLDEKSQTYPRSPSGMTGVQTLVPVMLDHIAAGRLSLARFVDMTSAGPARLFGIAGKGRVAAGYDADLTLVDLKRSEIITDAWIASKAGWSPYHGKRVTGWPVATIIRGRTVMRDGGLVEAHAGQAVRFAECYARS